MVIAWQGTERKKDWKQKGKSLKETRGGWQGAPHPTPSPCIQQLIPFCFATAQERGRAPSERELCPVSPSWQAKGSAWVSPNAPSQRNERTCFETCSPIHHHQLSSLHTLCPGLRILINSPRPQPPSHSSFTPMYNNRRAHFQTSLGMLGMG